MQTYIVDKRVNLLNSVGSSPESPLPSMYLKNKAYLVNTTKTLRNHYKD